MENKVRVEVLRSVEASLLEAVDKLRLLYQQGAGDSDVEVVSEALSKAIGSVHKKCLKIDSGSCA